MKVSPLIGSRRVSPIRSAIACAAPGGYRISDPLPFGAIRLPVQIQDFFGSTALQRRKLQCRERRTPSPVQSPEYRYQFCVRCRMTTHPWIGHVPPTVVVRRGAGHGHRGNSMAQRHNARPSRSRLQSRCISSRGSATAKHPCPVVLCAMTVFVGASNGVMMYPNFPPTQASGRGSATATPPAGGSVPIRHRRLAARQGTTR
jgi:hypothetical protein